MNKLFSMALIALYSLTAQSGDVSSAGDDPGLFGKYVEENCLNNPPANPEEGCAFFEITDSTGRDTWLALGSFYGGDMIEKIIVIPNYAIDSQYPAYDFHTMGDVSPGIYGTLLYNAEGRFFDDRKNQRKFILTY